MAATNVVSVSLRDYKGKTGVLTFHFPITATEADIETLMNTSLLGYVDAFTGCLMTDMQITKDLTLNPTPAIKVAPEDGVDFEKGGNFGFDVLLSDYRYTIRVPGLEPHVHTGENINLLETDVAVFITAVESGSGTALPSNRDGLDMGAAIEGKVTFHKS